MKGKGTRIVKLVEQNSGSWMVFWVDWTHRQQSAEIFDLDELEAVIEGRGHNEQTEQTVNQ